MIISELHFRQVTTEQMDIATSSQQHWLGSER